MTKGGLVVAVIVGAVVLPFCAVATAEELAERVRRPAALALDAGGEWLYVANQKAGTISAIELASRRVVHETPVGKRLSALVRWRDDLLLATDEGAHELILLRVAGGEVQVVERLAVAAYPVQVVLGDEGRTAAVASLWSRRVSLVPLAAAAPHFSVPKTIDLAFPPRQQLWLARENRLLVADSFTGRIGIVDPVRGSVIAREFPAHNIRGLATSPDGSMLVLAHQMLNDLAHTTSNDIHWGLLMSNDLRWLKLASLLDPAADLFAGSHMHPLGEANIGSGDPSGIAVTSRGTVVATLGGTGEVAWGGEHEFTYARVQVGRRPTAVILSRDERQAYVADTHSDAIAIIDLAGKKVAATIPLGPPPTLTAAERGELLFYNSRLSHDGWMSCHSCHTDGHANGQNNDNFSDESFGAPKRVLSLLGVRDTAPYAWNGSRPSLAAQVKASISGTMQGKSTPSESDVADLVAYMESLAPPPAAAALRGTERADDVARGKELFAELRCVRCHAGPTYTTPKTYDVGLVDKEGNREFNPPSLRGVGQRTPLFHDGSAAGLDDVLTKTRHKLPRELKAEELRVLKAFLESL